MADVCALAAAAASAAKEGREEEALAALAELLVADPGCALWPTMRARLRVGRPAEALADADLALRLDAAQPEARTLRARALAAGAGDPAEAWAAVRHARASPQLTPKLREELDAIEEALGAAAEGAAAPFGALGDATAGLDAICAMAAEASAAWKVGEVARAKSLFGELRALDAGSPLWASCLARLHLADAAYSEALGVCEAALSRAPRHAELLLLRGLSRLRAGALSGESAALADLRAARAIGGLAPGDAGDLAAAFEALGEPATVAAPAPAPPAFAPLARAAPAVKADAPGKSAAVCAKALQREAKGCFAEAQAACHEALRLEPGCAEAVLCLARMGLANAQPEAVAKLLRKDFPHVLRRAATRVEALCLAAAASELQGRWDEAVADLEAAAQAARPGAAAEAPGGAKTRPGAPCQDEVRGRLARALLHADERQEAAGMAQTVLETSTTQREASEVACAVLLDRGDAATALAVMLRCLIAHRNRPSSELADLVCGVMRRSSVEELVHVLAPNGAEALPQEQRTSIAEVVAYIGLIMKERSEVTEACRLYRTAAIMAPLHASLCLNLMHTFALRRDDLTALCWGLRYLDLLAASGVQAARGISAAVRGEAATAEALCPAQFSGGITAFYDTVAIGFVVLKIVFLAAPYTALTGSVGDATPATRPPWRGRIAGIRAEEGLVGAKPAVVESLAAIAAADEATAEAQREALLGLCRVLDVARQGHDLQRTLVRNEHAYFSCIYDILRQPLPAASSDPPQPVFVIGDSHVLSSAWRTVDLPPAEGRPTRLVFVPCVVTGAKLWHLRQASSFYTRFGFWDRVAAVPPGAPVMLVLGEIDCREGVLRAVQRGKYKSIEEALGGLVDLYVRLLHEVRRRLPRSPVFVHPVASALPETRFLTIAFNHLLGAAAQELQGVARLLDFGAVLQGGEPDLSLGPEGLAKLELLESLKLDGTHMAPAYVDSHLAPALDRAWRA